MDVAHFYGCKQEKNSGASTSSVTVSEAPAAAAGGGERPRHCDVPPYKCRKLIPATERCLLEPVGVWRVFPRQQMAFDCAKNCQQDAAVFAFESEELGTEGKRKYLVATYYEFGQQYFSAKSARHYYEVITEGSACRLYFDIEFKLEQNPHIEPVGLLETFIQYVCYKLYCQFDLHCDRTHVLDLDSTTKQKFSRHLIFHLPGAVFRNNLHAGSFIHHICAQLRGLKQQVDSGVSPQHAYQQLCGSGTSEPGPKTVCPPVDCLLALFVLNEKNEKILFCDEGVYTRNRNFRLFLSTKLGKEARLTVARENKFKSSYGESMRNRKSRLFNILMDSLVCNVRYERSARVLEFESTNSKQKRKRTNSKSSDAARSASTEEGYSYSPYPRVDQFITSLLTRGDVQGSVRRWTYFPQGKLLVYDIQHNRWCENIGRAHKSNNIMMVADLGRGVYYQKCHDPDCKRIDFRSQEYEIPPQFNPVLAQFKQDATSGITAQPVEGDSAQDIEESMCDEELFEKSAAELDLCESEVEPPRTEWTGGSKYDLLPDEQFLEKLITTETDVDFGPVPERHEGWKRDEDSSDELFAEASRLKTKALEMVVGETATGEWTDSPGNHTDSCEQDSLLNRALSEYERAENRPEAQQCHERGSNSIMKTASTSVKDRDGLVEPGVFDLSLEEVKAFCEDGD